MYKDNLENAADNGESVAVNDNNKSRSRDREVVIRLRRGRF